MVEEVMWENVTWSAVGGRQARGDQGHTFNADFFMMARLQSSYSLLSSLRTIHPIPFCPLRAAWRFSRRTSRLLLRGTFREEIYRSPSRSFTLLPAIGSPPSGPSPAWCQAQASQYLRWTMGTHHRERHRAPRGAPAQGCTFARDALRVLERPPCRLFRWRRRGRIGGPRNPLWYALYPCSELDTRSTWFGARVGQGAWQLGF
ncbi:hypothetical protein H4582DRAFT_131876 [Lactarius indigo]|nr:hypothetical protein H4582DRAFT_131876 [Lactarius indigo]